MYYPLKIKNIVLYCIVLYCIVLYCIVLYCIVLGNEEERYTRGNGESSDEFV